MISIDICKIKRVVWDGGNNFFRSTPENNSSRRREICFCHRLLVDFFEYLRRDIERFIPVRKSRPWIYHVVSLNEFTLFENLFGVLSSPNANFQHCFDVGSSQYSIPQLNPRCRARDETMKLWLFNFHLSAPLLPFMMPNGTELSETSERWPEDRSSAAQASGVSVPTKEGSCSNAELGGAQRRLTDAGRSTPSRLEDAPADARSLGFGISCALTIRP